MIILNPKLKTKLKKHQLEKKFSKQIKLLEINPQHPSLHVELLKPPKYGIYSFRIDLKYRALFVYRPDRNNLEVIAITVHYH